MGGSQRASLFSIQPRVVASGLISGAGFLAAMLADLAVANNQADDLVLLGGTAPVDPKRWRLIGVLLHFGNSVALAAAFVRLRSYLPGGGNRYLRGLIFIQIENLLLYPLVLIIGRYHPARRDGRLADFWSPVVFLQEVFRHAVFGLLLGALLDRD